MPDLSREYLTTSVPVIEDIVVPFMTWRGRRPVS